jgi:hypothetical protein
MFPIAVPKLLINATACRAVLPEARSIFTKAGRLPVVDGRAKISSSGGNAIALFASPDEIRSAVKPMSIDSNYQRFEDPSCFNGCSVYGLILAAVAIWMALAQIRPELVSSSRDVAEGRSHWTGHSKSGLHQRGRHPASPKRCTPHERQLSRRRTVEFC